MSAENVEHTEQPPATSRKVPPGFVEALGGVIRDPIECAKLVLDTGLDEWGITTRVRLQESSNPAVIE